MKVYVVILFLVTGCAVQSVTPSGGGFDMDIDVAGIGFRHGWTYIAKPVNTIARVYDEASIKRGEKLFKKHCQKCHGAEGKGNGELATALNIKPANLRILPKDLSRTYILVQIKEGKGNMPRWRDFLKGDEAKDLTNYIKELSETAM